ncbi:hypothetical protein ANO11243_086280 [Dothideomycetidae sp. 11243]|nr:hypothetical protein ANO11243_086280 [fungal sp. No.11243]
METASHTQHPSSSSSYSSRQPNPRRSPHPSLSNALQYSNQSEPRTQDPFWSGYDDIFSSSNPSSFGYLVPNDGLLNSTSSDPELLSVVPNQNLPPPPLASSPFHTEAARPTEAGGFFAEFPRPVWHRAAYARNVDPPIDSTPMPTTSTQESRKRAHRRPSDGAPPERKRQRHSGPSVQASGVEEIDLVADDTTNQDILKKEQEELLTLQRARDDAEPKSFGEMNCIICMDNFTDLTATPCGKLSACENSQ